MAEEKAEFEKRKAETSGRKKAQKAQKRKADTAGNTPANKETSNNQHQTLNNQ
jgi:hypothetical protein